MLGTYCGIALFSGAKQLDKPRPIWQLALPVLALMGAVLATQAGQQLNAGNELEQIMQQQRAVQRFEQAARISREIQALGFTIDRTAVPLVYYEAEALLSNGNVDAAEPLLQQSLLHNAGHLFTWANLGNIAFKNGDFELALQYYDALLALSPRMEEVLLNRAATLYRLNRFEEGMKTLVKAKESRTTDRYDTLNQALQKALREQRAGSSL